MGDIDRSDLAERLRLADSLLTALGDSLPAFERLLSEVRHEIQQLRHEEDEQGRDEEIETLRREVRQLREGMNSRAVIERAKGILMRSNAISESESFDLLNEMSQRRHRKLRDVAAEIADAVTSAPAEAPVTPVEVRPQLVGAPTEPAGRTGTRP
jgi:hypothetical protein